MVEFRYSLTLYLSGGMSNLARIALSGSVLRTASRLAGVSQATTAASVAKAINNKR